MLGIAIIAIISVLLIPILLPLQLLLGIPILLYRQLGQYGVITDGL